MYIELTDKYGGTPIVAREVYMTMDLVLAEYQKLAPGDKVKFLIELAKIIDEEFDYYKANCNADWYSHDKEDWYMVKNVYQRLAEASI